MCNEELKTLRDKYRVGKLNKAIVTTKIFENREETNIL